MWKVWLKRLGRGGGEGNRRGGGGDRVGWIDGWLRSVAGHERGERGIGVFHRCASTKLRRARAGLAGRGEKGCGAGLESEHHNSRLGRTGGKARPKSQSNPCAKLLGASGSGQVIEMHSY